mmetsp:Transcript_9108/g.19441  ORF Transcript_9108/g.19441 Transcript_9108/m.19441 type:complete len:81 (+) Transcript_9108:214-456(+)
MQRRFAISKFTEFVSNIRKRLDCDDQTMPISGVSVPIWLYGDIRSGVCDNRTKLSSIGNFEAVWMSTNHSMGIYENIRDL